MASEIHPEPEITELEVKLGVSFNNRELLRQALTHESFVNEWGADDSETEIASYERLEYLGDAVLNYAVANALFERSAAANEGELSMGRAHIVCKDSLAEAAQDLDLGDHVLRGKGEIAYSPNVRDSVLEDTFEAVIGAIHEDQGYEAARNFVMEQLGDKIEHVAKNGVDKDPKSAFQELVQGAGLKTPRYRTELATTEIMGEQTYRAHVFVDGRKVATGFGGSKSKAQKNAAEIAKSKFADGVPPVFARSASRRHIQTTAQRRQPTYSNSISDNGSVTRNLKRVAEWVNGVVLRRNGTAPRRQLIYKRSK